MFCFSLLIADLGGQLKTIQRQNMVGLQNVGLRPQLHCHFLERIMILMPGGPLNAVGVRSVRSTEIGTIQVRTVTLSVPPRALKKLSTVITIHVIVAVLRAECMASVTTQRITCSITYGVRQKQRTA